MLQFSSTKFSFFKQYTTKYYFLLSIYYTIYASIIKSKVLVSTLILYSILNILSTSTFIISALSYLKAYYYNFY